MVGFHANKFIYNGISSDEFGLYIASFNGGGFTENQAMTQEVIQDTTSMRIKPVAFGVKESSSITLSFTLLSKEYFDRARVNKVLKWLTNVNGYAPLFILQPDMTTVHYDCVFTDIQNVNINGYPIAYNVTAVCDTSFVEDSKGSVTVTSPNAGVDIYNFSSINDYTYPRITITMTAAGDFTVNNLTDETLLGYTRPFKLTGLASGEVITVDCANKTIKTTGTLNRYAVFSGNWLRLLYDKNTLSFVGSANVAMEWDVLKRYGS